jgi:hypothetical protein
MQESQFDALYVMGQIAFVWATCHHRRLLLESVREIMKVVG